MTKHATADLTQNLIYLKLPWIRENCEALAAEAAQKNWAHVEFLGRLLEGETHQRMDRATERRIQAAHFPVIKTLEQFDWSWPKTINRPQVQNLFRLQFIEQKANVVFLGGVGLGKSHLAVALGYQACLQGHRTLFTSAADIINTLSAAQAAHRLKTELRRYLGPALLLIDELGFMPIDKHGADLLFQVISQRYEQGAIVLTTNKAFKTWLTIFNNDATVTSAILDRLLHHAETVTIEGKSYRMKDRIEP
jgi:DNA replication protein DnaC